MLMFEICMLSDIGKRVVEPDVPIHTQTGLASGNTRSASNDLRNK